MRSQAKHVANLFFTVLLAGGLTLTACSSNQQASAPEEPQETVSVEVIGPDANDKDADYVAKTDYALADVEHGPPLADVCVGPRGLSGRRALRAWGLGSPMGGVCVGICLGAPVWRHSQRLACPGVRETDLLADGVSAFAAGFPLDVVHGVATVVFLMAFWGPWRRSITRVVRKYDLGGGN